MIDAILMDEQKKQKNEETREGKQMPIGYACIDSSKRHSSNEYVGM